MKILSIQYNFFTKKMEGLQKDVSLFSDVCQEYFKMPLKVTNLDDTKPIELPRIIGEAKIGFTLVCNMENLKIVYNNIPNEIDDSFILDTLSSIVSKMGTFLENYIDSPYNFTGVTLRVKVTKEELGEAPLMFLIKKLPITDTKTVIDNMNFKCAYIEPPFYINYGMHNETAIKVNAVDHFSKPTSVLRGEDMLIVEFDVNDKYAFINDSKYFPQVEDSERMMDNIIRFYNEELLEFIKTGKTDHFFLGK